MPETTRDGKTYIEFGTFYRGAIVAGKEVVGWNLMNTGDVGRKPTFSRVRIRFADGSSLCAFAFQGV